MPQARDGGIKARTLSPKWAAPMTSWKPEGRSVAFSSNAMGPSLGQVVMTRSSRRANRWCNSRTVPLGKSETFAASVFLSSHSKRMPVPVSSLPGQVLALDEIKLSISAARCL